MPALGDNDALQVSGSVTNNARAEKMESENNSGNKQKAAGEKAAGEKAAGGKRDATTEDHGSGGEPAKRHRKRPLVAATQQGHQSPSHKKRGLAQQEPHVEAKSLAKKHKLEVCLVCKTTQNPFE